MRWPERGEDLLAATMRRRRGAHERYTAGGKNEGESGALKRRQGWRERTSASSHVRPRRAARACSARSTYPGRAPHCPCCPWAAGSHGARRKGAPARSRAARARRGPTRFLSTSSCIPRAGASGSARGRLAPRTALRRRCRGMCAHWQVRVHDPLGASTGESFLDGRFVSCVAKRGRRAG
jgi:hypothetical protein